MIDAKVKQMTNVMLSMSEDDAAKLKALLQQTVKWDGGPIGQLAEKLYDALDNVGVEDAPVQFVYDSIDDLFAECR